jgi:hypothetical protein
LAGSAPDRDALARRLEPEAFILPSPKSALARGGGGSKDHMDFRSIIIIA